MKVLQINSVCGIKSTGRICTDLADTLEKKGHECKIAYGRENVPEKYQKIAYKIGSDFGVKIDGLLTRIFDNAGFNSKKSTKKLIAWIKEYNPDVIHLHNIHGYYINIELLFNFLKEFKKPVVWTLHDCWAFTGHCSYFTTAKCERWKSGCHSCPQKKSYPTSLLFDGSKKNYAKKKKLFTSLEDLTIVTPSEWLAEIVRKSFLGKYNIQAIPNGIDLNKFKPTYGNFREKYNLQDKKIVLGVATAWGNRKGIQEFAQLSELLPDDYKIVLVGMTEEQAAKMPDNILTLPRTNDIEELAQIYTEADVFVNAGKEETMGLTTVEAMACGTPVVVSNLTAVPEVVTKDGGIVLDELSAENIAKGVKYVISKEYTNTLANTQKYEKSKQFQRYIDIYLREIPQNKLGVNHENT